MAKKKHQIKSQQAKKSIKLLYQVIAAIAILALIIFLVFPDLLRKQNAEGEYFFKKEGELSFIDSLNNTKAKIDIEIADNDYERQLGLMKRKSMEEKQGMLFIFPVEEMQSFWMRNTLISLDMIFVNAQKEIVTIHKNTRALSDQSYPSSAPAIYVLEVIGGFTDKHNIKEGDKVSWMDTKL